MLAENLTFPSMEGRYPLLLYYDFGGRIKSSNNGANSTLQQANTFKLPHKIYLELLSSRNPKTLVTKLAKLKLGLFSHSLEIPNDANMLLSQILIGCSLLSQGYCKLIG